MSNWREELAQAIAKHIREHHEEWIVAGGEALTSRSNQLTVTRLTTADPDGRKVEVRRHSPIILHREPAQVIIEALPHGTPTASPGAARAKPETSSPRFKNQRDWTCLNHASLRSSAAGHNPALTIKGKAPMTQCRGIGRGGPRPGSGRPKGRKTDPAKLAQRRELTELARGCTDKALAVLISVAENEKAPAAARVSAADSLLNRAWGRPWQAPPYEPPAAKPAEADGQQAAARQVENVVVFDKNELRQRYLGAGKPGGTDE